MLKYLAIPMVLSLSACGLSAAEWGMGAGGVVAGTAVAKNGTPAPLPETYIGDDGQTHVDAAAVAQNQANEIKQDADTNMTQQASAMAVDFKNDAYKGAQETKDWLLTPPENKPMKAVPYSYCYTVYQDIMCYRQPMPGWEDRIVAYQGTGAPPPPVSITKPLPHVLTADEKQEARVATATPVFAKMPNESKDDSAGVSTAKANVPAQVDSAHETLPDPALAPQL
jgi:hypothetical protein